MATSLSLWVSMTKSGSTCIPMLRLLTRQFSWSSVLQVKKIEISKTENTTVIKGVPLEPDNQTVRTIKSPTKCPLCDFQDSITYRDVLILQQFISPDGQILPRYATGMCFKMQWKLQNILYQSYSAGLLPKYKPILPIGEDLTKYDKNYKWRKYNVYYDDYSVESPL